MASDPTALPRLLVLECDWGLAIHPLLFRPLAALNPLWAGLYDVTSCYGYGGPAWACWPDAEQALLREFWAAEAELLRSLGVVCEFVRLHPLLPAQEASVEPSARIFRGQTVAIDLTRPQEELWTAMDSNHRRNIAKAHRLGVQARHSSHPTDIDAFIDLYTLSMDRLEARRDYYFPRSCFADLFRLPSGSAWLATAWLEGQAVAGLLNLAGPSFFHYHLGGSADRARDAGVNHFLLFRSFLWAREMGKTQMHLGGGYGAQDDGLLRFKKGFGGRLCRYSTVQRVLLPAQYAQICRHMGIEPGAGAFFPAYRDPALASVGGAR